ncbi:MAG: hypothetical protein QOJ06_974, partial [Pseudonocardiales bacterium]|nr:hypothetical protein [Pseudonocardiales bacterium]
PGPFRSGLTGGRKVLTNCHRVTVIACCVQSRLMRDSEDAASAQPARAGDLLKQQCLSPAAFGWTPLLDRGLMSA